jgi:MFS family permease
MTHHKRNLLVLSITIGLASLSWTQIIPFLPRYLTQLGVRGNLTAWSALVLGMQSVAGIVFMPFWGKMGDKYGRKPMVLRAGFCLSGIYVAMTFCTQPWHLAVLRFLNGMLTGFLPGSFALIATNTPTKKAGHYVAIAQSAAAIGTIAGPVAGGVFADLMGIRGAMLVSGACVFMSTIAVAVLVREPNRARPVDRTTLINDFVTCARNPSLRYIMVHNWTNAIMAGAVTSTLVIYLSQIGPVLPSFAQGAVFSIPGVLIAVFALRWVKLGERLSFRKVIAVGLIGAGFFYVIMGLSISAWMFIPAFVLCRVFATSVVPSLSAIISTEVSEGFRGRAFGIQTSVGTMGDLSAQLCVATVGQMFGIRALYFLIGVGVFSLGIRDILTCATKPRTTPASMPPDNSIQTDLIDNKETGRVDTCRIMTEIPE